MRSTFPLFALALAASAPVLGAETIPVSGFRSVELRGGGVVTVVPGPAQRVTIIDGSSQVTRIRVEGDGRLRIDTCTEQCPRSYRLRVEIQSPTVPSLAVSGGGLMTALRGFGPQQRLSAAVNGGGTVDARAVDVADVSAAVNGGGEVLVRPRVALSAAVNGGGHVRYSGNPSVSMAVHGGGSVSPGY